MAAEMFKQVTRVLTKDAYVKPESVQVLIDLARESAKVTKPVTVSEVVDYSFFDKARKELGITKIVFGSRCLGFLKLETRTRDSENCFKAADR